MIAKNLTNEYKKVKTHTELPTENKKVKVLVQSLAHDNGDISFVDIRKFRTNDGKELKFTPKGIHFHKSQLEGVIEGLLDAYERINGVPYEAVSK